MKYRAYSALYNGISTVRKASSQIVATAFIRIKRIVESRSNAKSAAIAAAAKDEWRRVQERYGSVEGQKGIEDRQRYYPPFFQRFGRDVRIDAGCYFSAPERIVLDDGTRINRGGIFEASSAIRIGRNVRVGHRCFIHSANHDIAADAEKAFFERGYIYDPVLIGDNSLISANVSLLPGLDLGNGSFVAANAVLPGKKFAEGTYLAGVPARPLEPKFRDQQERVLKADPAVAILVLRRDSAREEAAKLLVSILGMPQIMIAAVGEALPSSVKAVVCLEEISNLPEGMTDVWQPSDADGTIQEVSVCSNKTSAPKPLNFERITYRAAVNGFDEEPGLINTTQATVFVTSNAFHKGTPEMRRKARCAWCLCLIVALRSPTKDDLRWDSLFEQIGPLIDDGISGANWRLKGKSAEALLKRAFEKRVIIEPKLRKLFDSPTTAVADSISKFLFEHAWLIPYLALTSGGHNGKQCKQILDQLALDVKTSTLKACLGIAYVLLGDEPAADEISDELLAEQWYQPNSSLVRQVPGATAIDRQPPLVALLTERFMRQLADGMVPVLPPVGERDLEWRVFANEGDADACSLDDFLLAPKLRAYSRSLIENWLALQEIPEFNKGHFYLDDSNYHRSCEALERCWSKLFEHVFQHIDVTAVRMRPWPAGYDYAISIRYDVDRDISSVAARNIVRIQRECLNAACGSWYFIAEAPHNERVKNFLKFWNQEFAHHSCLRSEPEAADVGVTAHSAGNSEYWRGRRTICGLEDSHAAYGEAMLSAFSLPRPGWLGERRTSVWLTPLHFPLEGSTQDTTTEYFDLRREQFNAQIANGGLVIIGSHPDCQQSVLEKVLARVETARGWPVPVRRAVDRVRALFDPGNIAILTDTDTDTPSPLYLSSLNTIADVVVEYRYPNEKAGWQREVVQLQSGRPRKLRFSMCDNLQSS